MRNELEMRSGFIYFCVFIVWNYFGLWEVCGSVNFFLLFVIYLIKDVTILFFFIFVYRVFIKDLS